MLIRKTAYSSTDQALVQPLYESGFPAAERLPYEMLVRFADKMPVGFFVYRSEDRFVGFTYTAYFKDIAWLFYFAVEEELRGEGYGSLILAEHLATLKTCRIIIDIESTQQTAENSAERANRKAFYERAGFKDTNISRSYRGITYQIMVRGEGGISEEEYNRFIQTLHQIWHNIEQHS